MRLSKLVGPFFFALSMVAAGGCATESGEEMGESDDAITGSIQDARLQRIKQAYIDAKLEDFTEIAPLLDDAALAQWNVDVQDPHWFTFQVDGRAVVAIDFLGDTNAVLTGSAPVAGGRTSSFVILFDTSGAGETATYNAVLLYDASANRWEGLTRALKDATANTADGGVVALPDGGSSMDGGAPHTDGGADGGVDGSVPHTDGGVDGGAHLDAGPG